MENLPLENNLINSYSSDKIRLCYAAGKAPLWEFPELEKLLSLASLKKPPGESMRSSRKFSEEQNRTIAAMVNSFKKKKNKIKLNKFSIGYKLQMDFYFYRQRGSCMSEPAQHTVGITTTDWVPTTTVPLLLVSIPFLVNTGRQFQNENHTFSFSLGKKKRPFCLEAACTCSLSLTFSFWQCKQLIHVRSCREPFCKCVSHRGGKTAQPFHNFCFQIVRSLWKQSVL